MSSSSPEHRTFVAAHGDRLTVVPQHGGLVTGWTCRGPWGEREILYFDAERFSDPAKSVRGGIPILFPICGSLPGSAMAQHGFARDMPWQVGEFEDGVRLSLRDTPESLAVYPHRFALELDLRLEPQAMGITARVRNTGANPMPFSFGLHPYFAVDDLDTARVSGLPDPLPDLAQGVDMVTGPVSSVRLETGEIVVTLETEDPLNLVVVWTDPPRPTVCVEPWTAPVGALSSGERLLNADPGQSVELKCRFQVASTGRGTTGSSG